MELAARSGGVGVSCAGCRLDGVREAAKALAWW